MYDHVTKGELVVGASFNAHPYVPVFRAVGQTRERVGQFVADERLQRIEQARDEHLRRRRSDLDRAIRSVYEFDDREIRGEDDGGVVGRADSHQPFARAERVDNADAERLVDSRAILRRQRFTRGRHAEGRDPQTTRELLLRELANDCRVTLEKQRLKVVHALHDRLEGIGRRDPGNQLGSDFDALFARRLSEADAFYATVVPDSLPDDAKRVMRQALGGLLWTKQFYHYDVRRWLEGDPTPPPPPPERRRSRNHEWTHLYNSDVISMPDKWEYPWYAAWDLAFHCLPIALVDPDFAKEQLILLLREWYMHPNGQLPAYEWSFSDVNPPVHAWAAWRVYKIDKRLRGTADRTFLERVFHKLLLNFTWWVNRKDAEGLNIFQGGFLGLDNIGVFDRSAPLPTGGYIEQSDGTSWMGMYCLNMLAMALELAHEDSAYEDVASKFFEHFVYIAHATHDRGGEGISLWNEADGFFYDVLHLPDGRLQPLTVRSMVGLIPLFAVETIEPEMLRKLPGFARRMQWFIDNRPEFAEHVEMVEAPGRGTRRLLSIVTREQLPRVLRVMLDEQEFLSDHGIRSLSRCHLARPYVLDVDGVESRVRYEPAESSSGIFGGNSNWRGPVWFPVNHLIIESLQKFDHFYGDALKVQCPTGSERMLTLWEVSLDLSRRLAALFMRDPEGRRPAHGLVARFQADPHWRELVLFYEYFHGDTGAGLGASHQTGWTGLVAKLMEQYGRRDEGG